MGFKVNGLDAQGGGGAATGIGQPAPPFVATHLWQSKDFDYPCTLTGRAWHDEAIGQDFIEVQTEDGTARPVPKHEVIAKPNKRAKKTAFAKLTPADAERLKSWMLEIADDALGDQHEEGDGSFRFGSNRALIINSSGFFYSFTADRGGTGGVDLLALLHGLKPDDAVSRAQEWLQAHAGLGSLSDDIEDRETSKAAGDAERIAFNAAIWAKTSLSSTRPDGNI